MPRRFQSAGCFRPWSIEKGIHCENARVHSAVPRRSGSFGVRYSQPGAIHLHTLRVYQLCGAAGRPRFCRRGRQRGAVPIPQRRGREDGAGNVYVADKNNFVIRKITPDGVVTTLAGMHGQPGTADGVGIAARFGSVFGGPTSVALDSAGNVYVTDTYNATIRKITPDGGVTTLAGVPGSFSSVDGPGATARFLGPVGITFGIDGNLYVTDGVAVTGGYIVRRVTLAGVVTTLAGSPTQSGAKDGTNGAALFGAPFMGGPAGIVMDTTTNLFVADTYNDTIRMVSPQGSDWVVKTLFGVTGMAGFTDGVNGDAPGDALLDNPYGLAVDASGDLYESDSPAQTVRSISYPSITTIAGLPTVFGSNDGMGGAARFLTPEGLAVDAQYNVYVADFGNQTIRKISPTASDWVVTTLAGLAGGPGYADGAGVATQFYLPTASRWMRPGTFTSLTRRTTPSAGSIPSES